MIALHVPACCGHCRERAITRPRGLCSPCYADPAIRASFPSDADRRCVGCQGRLQAGSAEDRCVRCRGGRPHRRVGSATAVFRGLTPPSRPLLFDPAEYDGLYRHYIGD